MSQWVRQVFSNVSMRNLAATAVGLLTLMGIIIFAAYELTKMYVTVEVGDETLTVYTHASTVGEVLKEQEIQYGDHDYIEPSVDTHVEEAMNIVYKPAQKVFVTHNGKKEEVWTIANTVQELMDELNIKVNEHDHLSPSLETSIVKEMDIYYKPAMEVTLISDGKEKQFWTTSTTVADFLKDEKIELGKDDRVEPSITNEIEEEMEIKVIRVEKVTDVVEETINYAVVKRNDASLEKGQERVLESGQEGKVKKYYEVVLEDGKEVSRELVKEEEVQQMKERVVAVGTKTTTPTSIVSRDNSTASSSGEWRTFVATAYNANCTGCSGITKTGINLHKNPNAKVIAVDPNVIPLGSRVEIKGMGTYLAADTGSAIKGNRIDIFQPNANYSFGRQTVQLRIVQ